MTAYSFLKLRIVYILCKYFQLCYTYACTSDINFETFYLSEHSLRSLGVDNQDYTLYLAPHNTFLIKVISRFFLSYLCYVILFYFFIIRARSHELIWCTAEKPLPDIRLTWYTRVTVIFSHNNVRIISDIS